MIYIILTAWSIIGFVICTELDNIFDDPSNIKIWSILILCGPMVIVLAIVGIIATWCRKLYDKFWGI